MELKYDKYRVRTYDDNNLVVEEQVKISKGKNVGAAQWQIRGYFGDVRSALVKVSKLTTFNAKDREELIGRIDDMEELIKTLPRGYKNVK